MEINNLRCVFPETNVRCMDDVIDSSFVPPTSDRLVKVYNELKEWEAKPNMQFRSSLRGDLFLGLSQFIPGISMVADMLLNGASYNFLETPPYFGPNSFPHLVGDRLATVKEDALK